MYGTMIDELEWYKAMSIDPRDSVHVCDTNGREIVPYDTLDSACKCCARCRNNAQWQELAHTRVYGANVCMDVRGFTRLTLYVD